jgi:methionyl-tRNA formyltransferase
VNPGTDGLQGAASVLRTAATGRVRTVFLGSGGFGVPALDVLAGHPDIDLRAVVTAPTRPTKRGARVGSTPIEIRAQALGVASVLSPERLRATDAVADVLRLDPELLVLADYGQIVPPSLLELRHGALNLHPSLLPRHRGATPIPAAILAGDAETGVSLIRMDAGLDTGPLVAQRRVPLGGDEVAPDLEVELARVAADLLADALVPWLRGDVPATPQPEDGATLTRPLRRADGRLDPARRAEDLERQVRAYQPWPGSFLDTRSGRIVVWRATVGPATGTRPGTLGPTGMSTVAGDLVLHEVQPAGGRRMTWEAFLRGRPGIVGDTPVASDP